jgi:hypothetical protein
VRKANGSARSAVPLINSACAPFLAQHVDTAPPYGGVIPIKLSNSQVSFFRWSHARTANRLPLRLGMLLRPRCGNPARSFGFYFRWLPQVREQSAAKRTRDACPCEDRRRSCETGSPYGAPLRRLWTVGPLCLAGASGGVTGPDIIRRRDGRFHPEPLSGPGGLLHTSPGTTTANRGRRVAAPHPRQASPAERPSVDGDASNLYRR